MSFPLECSNDVEREEHDRPIGAAMIPKVVLSIAVEPRFGDERFEDAALGHSTARNLYRRDVSRHH
jgi:hypothetical protein